MIHGLVGIGFRLQGAGFTLRIYSGLVGFILIDSGSWCRAGEYRARRGVPQGALL